MTWTGHCPVHPQETLFDEGDTCDVCVHVAMCDDQHCEDPDCLGEWASP